MDNNLKKVVSAIVKDFLKKNKRNPKDEKELALFVQSQGGDKYIKKKTQEILGEQTQEQTSEQKLKAAHGAKLNYFKSLKHKCADDEELYYYKKGGSVGCGCKKKEDGGEVKQAKSGCKAVEKFKAIRKGLKGPKDTLKFKDLAARDSFYINTYGAEDLESTRPGSYVRKPNSNKTTWVPDRTKAPYNKLKETKKQEGRREEPFEPNPRPRPKSTTTIKRDTSRSIKTQLQKTGGSVVEKFKSARCGSKMKKK